jgi:hypothetical protein
MMAPAASDRTTARAAEEGLEHTVAIAGGERGQRLAGYAASGATGPVANPRSAATSRENVKGWTEI